MRHTRYVLLAAALVAACKQEAGPRPQPGAEAACQREPEPSLSDFCDQSREFRDLCERYETYDEALEYSLADCTETGFPLAIAECDERVIDRSHPTGGVRLFYDSDGDLVGVRFRTDVVFDCPPGGPRDRSVKTQRAGRVDDDCEPCLVCGAVFDDDEPAVCSGDLGQPYVDRCRDTFDFHPQCEPCACQSCYPFTYTDLADTAELFHLCVEDNCEACTVRPPDAGTEPEDAAVDSGPPDSGSTEPDEDAGT